MSQKFNGVLKISQLFFRSNLIIHQTRINAKLYIWTDHIYPLFSSREKGWIHHQKVKVKVKLVTPRPSLSRPVYLKYLSYRTSQKKKEKKRTRGYHEPLNNNWPGLYKWKQCLPPYPMPWTRVDTKSVQQSQPCVASTEKERKKERKQKNVFSGHQHEQMLRREGPRILRQVPR